MSDLAVIHGGRPDPSQFFTSEGFLSAVMGEYLNEDEHFIIGEDGQLYRYARGAYRRDGEARVRSRVRDLLGIRFKRRHLDETLAWLKAAEARLPVAPPCGTINVANGLLDWRTGDLSPHSHETHSAVQIPVAWKPEATCKAIDDFLRQVLPEDAVEIAYELAGYSLYAGNPMRVAVLLLGPGGNGKSVLLRILETMLGESNTAFIPLQQFAENRFAAAELVGKLANVCGDLDARSIKQTDTFKMLTGGDRITAERKYGQPFAFTSMALPIFSANEAPLSSDQSQAWFDRWIVVPMEAEIPVEERDPTLSKRLTQPEELEGFLAHAVIGLERLMRRGHFELPESIVQAKDAYRDRLDTVRAFLGDETRCDPQTWIARKDLYSAYRRWCGEQGRHPLAAPGVYQRLRRDFPGSIEERKREGIFGFLGLKLVGGQL